MILTSIKSKCACRLHLNALTLFVVRDHGAIVINKKKLIKV